MFFNGAKCDIYIGSRAGKKLMNDISKAQKSIEIVSPFLNKSLLDIYHFSKRSLGNFWGDSHYYFFYFLSAL